MNEGRLALDIETASPNGTPSDFRNTADFELVAVGLGFCVGDGDPEVEVVLRDGDWSVEHTAGLLREVVEWCEARSGPVITYNGEYFDEHHLRAWAEQVADEGVWSDAPDRVDSLFADHIDLGTLAAEAYPHAVRQNRDIPALWKACKEAGIDQPTVWYDDYELDSNYLDRLGIDEKHVKGAHVGEALGEAYVDGVVAGIDHTQTHTELTRLLAEYAAGDIAPLFSLHDALRQADAQV
ncbi:hypothetical protein E6P09_13965 [Haloferax mediterranei ATCC 33500]|uniref:Uncharacterized protein n=1 Tax=Haloferax mediterranei (strain ATCC 33500 / DSM 1411 / JCM 8866 / NBRC 14739 / NCIMB 2177 / R-4) TaxID=523841 RepID=I3R7N4_HALMT|nr:hypothetical protein [Haloferax mediterranei]AFK20244.1 hypothetical protein HFX_2563 [Haloferax mediterranei ATCC 33500]AHZ23614.1 hypothetical protein BM92_13620 [Haloferax mediterranei ATCC 33500]ELZ99099.1 hypothetical protein C439_14609 [Haloferax mediterranei ATCC 33500]MDX5987004.1 hypothetical protein [Haloferax mediterranei ATCC 33500]QCQ76321.1 hypothetical protein E6P09_13965 [Haloferax mediterranei ATCC 33500]